MDSKINPVKRVDQVNSPSIGADEGGAVLYWSRSRWGGAPVARARTAGDAALLGSGKECHAGYLLLEIGNLIGHQMD
ncbi:hypothetical protein C2845_PM01G21650 [Panicum miliaceum]|uniref:Uncharacterized protein n=1 Tax=Panicum miliaceum TaxID=4540 RepID=A0A3L6TGQ2_PANMI|nr:hypothetical protein C2845_PM01G21650 [Panicum miliaceum]